MTAVLLTPLFESMLDNNGFPLAGGSITSYVAGTSTLQNTYVDALGITPAANPLTLDAAGRPPNGGVWGSGIYKFILKDSAGVQVGVPVDNVTAVFGAGDMTKAVYDPANIAQQLVGTTAVQTLTNKTITTNPSSTSGAGLTITVGVAPTSPVDGAFWTTTAGAFVRANGATIQIGAANTKWAVFNGATTGTNAPTNGSGVASITRNSVGQWTATFSTAFANANFATAISGTGTAGNYAVITQVTSRTSSTVTFSAMYGAGSGSGISFSLTDLSDVSIMCIGS